MNDDAIQIFNRPWAILPRAMQHLTTVVRNVRAGSTDTMQAASGREPRSGVGGVQVIGVRGPIVPREPDWNYFGVVGVDRITKQVREAMNDNSVDRIVFDIDSPGGDVSGVAELADEIYSHRGTKPMTAVADSLMASAAYWIGSAADEVVVTPTGRAGSIGVLAVHEDYSGMLSQAGIDVSLITAGKHKAEGNPFEPLPEEARAAIQKDVDVYYTMFVNAVARQRGVAAADVRHGMGEGRVLIAGDAVAAGLADRVGTMDDVISSGSRGRRRGARADVDFRRRRLRLAVPYSEE